MRFNVHIKSRLGVKLKAKLEVNSLLLPDMKKLTMAMTLVKDDKQYDLPLSCIINEVKAGNIYCELDDKGNDTLENFINKME